MDLVFLGGVAEFLRSVPGDGIYVEFQLDSLMGQGEESAPWQGVLARN